MQERRWTKHFSRKTHLFGRVEGIIERRILYRLNAVAISQELEEINRKMVG